MYDPKSLKAEEFICHEEIEDTLKYADENKDNMPLIREILDKARLCKGLSHREASVLLACENPEILDEIYKLANTSFMATALSCLRRCTFPTTA